MLPRPDPAADRARRFDPACEACPRLAGFLAGVRARWPAYHARPVPAFGAGAPGLLIVGLAPGLHGANASGRPFTGDHAGILLYRTLHEFGFASAPVSEHAGDGLRLRDARITNAVRCVPPANRPTPAEARACNDYLRHDLQGMRPGGVVLALGRIAHEAVLRALDQRPAAFAFGHGRWHAPAPGMQLVDSYHCSRYNTQTRRLTDDMFRAVFAAIRDRLPA